MTTSVRLDAETEARLTRLARRRGVTKSDILREAIERLAALETEPRGNVYERVADLVGVAQGGPADLGRRHKARFRQLLSARGT
jgi:hypothetical protein